MDSSGSLAMMRSKHISRKIFEYKQKSRNPKSPFFYAIIFAIVFIFCYVQSKYSNSRILYFNSTNHGTDSSSFEESTTSDSANYDPLIPPANASREVRMAWFRTQIPKLELLHSTTLSQQFHDRVTGFLNKGCSVLFHIIWFSPAKHFGKREFLTMDTFFKAHPDGCLIVVSRSMDTDSGYATLKPLIDRGFKVGAITPDVPFLVKDTPAEAWLELIKSGNRDPGDIPLSQNLSNLVRLAMLYKYGGGYMDTDIIVLKDFLDLRNAIGAQSLDFTTKQWNRLNNAVMMFDNNHPVVWEFLQEFSTTFNGNKWGNNGPYLVSRVMARLEGHNITILPPKAFYPVDWNGIGKLYKKPEGELESRWVESQIDELSNGESYAVHLWNKRSKNLAIEEGSVMARLVSTHCVVCDTITT
ncbi:hypothetical protein HN51_005178 [Arachis hypogaea]|uniref:Alpha 1,4-glycosyltransferase domain-containing protein n=3 Tax=Arachis TaxID=3817 RepID=A0A445DFR0_ARAHY|nr:uncharacterized protein LOC107484866 [Arachis duranensis]XP_025695493.1 lactosylceramide 4-alpha-galactosyltransferase-like [Arachis hypogaea]QHO38893.1 uncharacterized protein DS421_4g124360 [Arachis hypogaea]RYR62028.1 hypothetical protein Ahy_A04g019332 [Arachis hypogaea]